MENLHKGLEVLPIFLYFCRDDAKKFKKVKHLINATIIDRKDIEWDVKPKCQSCWKDAVQTFEVITTYEKKDDSG